MTQDERQLFGKMLDLVQGVELGAASDATTNLMAALIVAEANSLKDADLLAKAAGVWRSTGGRTGSVRAASPEAVHTNDLANAYSLILSSAAR